MPGVSVVVSHEVKPGIMSSAADRIRGNGDRMAACPGFIDRELYRPTDGTDVLVTVTRWESLTTYEGWVEHNRANNPHAGKQSPFTSPPTTIVLQSVDEEA